MPLPATAIRLATLHPMNTVAPRVNAVASRRTWLPGLLLLLGTLSGPNPLPPLALAAESPHFLWEIGRRDQGNAEFALGPSEFGKFRDDGFVLVGRSDLKRDWPYVHPGPFDGWGGARPHTFTIAFGLAGEIPAGNATLHVALVDTHAGSPPELLITINGHEFSRKMPAGGGDASVFGEPAKGRPHQFDVAFPLSFLRAGANEVAIKTVSGSWMLYDWLGLEAPGSLTLTDTSSTVVGSITSPPVLVERGGKLMQTVDVTIQHFGKASQGKLEIEGIAPVSVNLPQGVSRHEIAVPAVDATKSVAVDVSLDGKVLAHQTLTLRPVRKWVVYLLPHSHVDIGYTHVQTDVEKAQWKYLEMAIDAARKSAGNPAGSRFKWNVEVLWAVDSYLKQATPEKQQAFFDAVKAGQVGLQALYGNELTGLCRPEELLRLMGFAQTLSQRAGVPITSAMITDVPGYTWGMVPAFAQSGVKYFSIGPNGGDRIGHTISAWGDKPFWWIGPNGRDKVLAWMTGTGYYRVFSSPENLMSYLGQLESQAYPYDSVQVRHCLGDNGAPDVDFADTVKAWNETHAFPKLVIATTEEMFRDFEQRYGDQIPTAKGDFTPYWEDGAGSSARETALNRAAADRLTQAETVFALFQPKSFPAEAFYQAWRNVVLYDEHTWGAHNSISEPDHPFVKSQWAIKQAFALDADQQSRKLLDAANQARGPLVSTTSGAAIDVISTISAGFPYTLVRVPRELSLAGDGVGTSPEASGTLVSQRLSSGELIFRPCLAAYTASRFHISSRTPQKLRDTFPAARADGITLKSERSSVAASLHLRLDPLTGDIASLVSDGRELVNTQAVGGLNSYNYLPGSDLKNLARDGAVRISVKEKGPLLASLLVESTAPGCRSLSREYRLHALRNYVEIIDTIDKEAVRAKEGIHFGFPFHVPDGVVRMDVPWGTIRPELDQIPGACRNWFTVQRWVDISNDRFGVTLLTPDTPLVEVGGITANLIGGLNGSKLWLEHLDPSQTVYSWAMNNHWHTNYRAEQEGPTVFRYILHPHSTAGGTGSVGKLALEHDQPFLVLPARGELPNEPLFVISGKQGSPSVQVTAFKPSDDGQAWIIRLLETGGNDQQIMLNWRNKAHPATWLSDNSELPRTSVEGAVPIPARSVVTLRVAFQTP